MSAENQNERNEEVNEQVNHPSHYASGDVECIEISRHMDFNMGNAFKYLWRHPTKHGGTVDLKKSNWYINDWCDSVRLSNPVASKIHPVGIDDSFKRMMASKQFDSDKIDVLMLLFFGYWYRDLCMIKNVVDYIDSEIEKVEMAA